MPDSARARALVLERPHHLVIHDIPLPALGDDDALVRVEACGLCGTDHEQYTGELAGGFAFVPGHETIGIVETIGPRAAQRWGVAAGDRVAVEVFQSCRDCKACVDGRVPPVRAPRPCRHVRVHLRRPRTRAVGWLRRVSVPGTRFDGAAGADGARPGRRDGVQPARGRNPLGCNDTRHRAGRRGRRARSWHPRTVRRARRPRRPVPSS